MSKSLADLRRVVADAETLAESAGELWGYPVEGRWLLVRPDGWYFNQPVPESRPVAGFWRIEPAAGVGAANTAFEWAGHRWAMVAQLVDDPHDRQVLLLHELFHAQVEGRLLGALHPPPPDDTLERPEGRALLRAELRAWCLAALGEPTACARVIRAHRRATTPAMEAERQRSLELSEGLAEYSARVWTQEPAEDMCRQVQHRDLDQSLVRSACYDLGPAIGYALDRHVPGWRARVDATMELGALASAGGDEPTLAEALHRVGHDVLLAEEREGWERLAEGRERRRRAFEEGAVLWLGASELVFDPRYVETVAAGTLYLTGSLTSAHVRLGATDGLCVTADWSRIGVACPDRPRPGATRLAGPGWTAELDEPWENLAEWVDKPA